MAELNGVLLAAVAEAVPAATPPNHDGGPMVAWWKLGTGGGYLRGQLIWHLTEAGRGPEAEALACDLRWAGARLAQSGPAAVAADLAMAATPRAVRLAAEIIRVAHLLAPAEPTGAVVDILHSRLAADPDWGSQVAALRNIYQQATAGQPVAPARPPQPCTARGARRATRAGSAGCAR